MPPTTTIDDRVNVKNRDIPDLKKKRKPDDEPMADEVQAEAKLRPYMRKDGLFIKDLLSLRILQRKTGRVDKKSGQLVMENKYTLEEANAYVTELMERSGRTVGTDPISGRPKAVPGWDLAIQVPGMLQSEQMAPKEPEGAAAQQIRDNAMLAVQADNKELKEAVRRLEGGAGARKAKELRDMGATELRDFAADNEIAVPPKVSGKIAIREVIEKELAERKTDEDPESGTSEGSATN